MRRAAVVLLAFAALTRSPAAVRAPSGFFPIGVRYRATGDSAEQRRDLEDMRRLRFNVVSLSKTGEPDSLAYIDRLLAGAPYSGLTLAADRQPVLIADGGGAADLRARAWAAYASGAGAILFDWAMVRAGAEESRAAVAFAEAITRNVTLYAPMRPRVAGGKPDVTVAPAGGTVTATLLESDDALLLVAVNRGRTEQRAVLAFAPWIPEAIWQNMETGATINFVTGAGGTTYTRTFAPKDVLVLMINKRIRARD